MSSQEKSSIGPTPSLDSFIDTGKIKNLRRAVERTGTTVAFVGLVKRGKSTLVNQIAGVRVCNAGPTPQTALVVSVSNGEPMSSGTTVDGVAVELPISVQEFRAATARSASMNYRDAEFRGATRLPESVVLIDTPGFDEALVAGAEDAHLRADWTSSGANAAVLVMSVPPGPSESETELYRLARSVFGSNTCVVLKATDSSISKAALEESATVIQQTLGVRPLIVAPDSDVSAEDRFGFGPTAGVDHWIGAQLADHRNKQERASQELREIIDDACVRIDSLTEDDLPALKAAEGDQSLPPELLRACRRRRTMLEQIANDEKAAKQRAADTHRLEMLENNARVLRATLSNGDSTDLQIFRETYRELISLATDGSDVALTVVRDLLGTKAGVLAQLGSKPSEIVAGIDSKRLDGILPGLLLSRPTLIELLREAPPNLTHSTAFEACLLSSVQRLSYADVLQIHAAAPRATRWRSTLTSVAEVQYLHELSRDYLQSIPPGAPPAVIVQTDLARLSFASNAILDLENRTQFATTRSHCRLCRERLAVISVELLEIHWRTLHLHRLRSWDPQDDRIDVARSVSAIALHAHRNEATEIWNAAFADDGDLARWLRQSRAEAEAETARQNRRSNVWRALFYPSLFLALAALGFFLRIEESEPDSSSTSAWAWATLALGVAASVSWWQVLACRDKVKYEWYPSTPAPPNPTEAPSAAPSQSGGADD